MHKLKCKNDKLWIYRELCTGTVSPQALFLGTILLSADISVIEHNISQHQKLTKLFRPELSLEKNVLFFDKLALYVLSSVQEFSWPASHGPWSMIHLC